MKRMNRRDFLSRTVATTAGLSLGVANLNGQALGANDQIRVAVAGIRGRGNGHTGQFQKLKGVEVVALCEPDQNILDKRLAEFKEKHNKQIAGDTDIRRILDRKDVDAVVIATPNHWHSLMTIWACQAGKHVYVEKPVSHSVWEGRKMVEAARKYNRIVQAGTQQRSCPAVQECARDIQAGKYGKVLWVHCSKLGARGPIGKVTTPQPVPDHIDYNLWAGPAPMTPVMRKSFHYDWHWQWNWGDGEMGNWGIHYIDDFRHILGWDSVPTSVMAAGNRFAWDDNGQTPNMHMALFDYDGLKVVVDIRNLPDPKRPEGQRPGGSRGAVYLGSRGGNHIQCEKGYIRISRGGGWAYDNDGNRVHQYAGDGGRDHIPNFIEALRSNNQEKLNAEIEVCHLSTAVCHQANISYRVGNAAPLEEIRADMKVHEDALNTLNDMVQQVEGNDVDLSKNPFMFGPKLTFDRQSERFTGKHAEKANALLKTSYRPGFVISENV